MSAIKTLTPQEFRKMQLLQLDMLVELDRVCQRHNIRYAIFAGTLLGAVRHKGYIPWDDDSDVAMLREDYEKFKKVAHELNPDLCYFQDHTTDPYYRWGYGKLRRTGTTYVRVGQEHLKCKTGVFVDIFPMDDCPNSTIGQMLQDFHCFCLRKILWSEVGKKEAKGFVKLVYSLLSKIPVSFVFSQLNLYANWSKNNMKHSKVRTLCYTAIGKLYYKHPLKQRYGMPKKWFLTTDSFLFEGKKLMGLQDYDSYLKFCFGNYMKLPPESARVMHAPVSDYKF